MFQKVLVPLDGSQRAEAVLPYVARLANDLKAPVVLLSVVDSAAKDLPKRILDAAGGAQMSKLEAAYSKYLESIAKGLADQGIKAQHILSKGKPEDEVVSVAMRESCELIVLPKNVRSASLTGNLGAVTAKVLRASELPVLLITAQKAVDHKAGESLVKTIAVTLDGSPLAETALPYVEELARRLNIEVTLVRVVRRGSIGFAAMDTAAYTNIVELEEAAQEEAADYLKGVAARLRAAGCKAQVKALNGAPAFAIVDLAHQTPGALLALTTHGRSGMQRWMLGSVTEEVLRSTWAPALVLPQQYSKGYALTVTELLGQTPIFANMSPGDLKSLAQVARTRKFKAGEVIFKEGEEAVGCFIITRGQVEVIRGLGAAQQTVLATLGPGDFFGEMAILDDHPRSASVRAVTDLEAVSILRGDFLAELRKHPQVGVAMLPFLVKRLRRVSARVTD